MSFDIHKSFGFNEKAAEEGVKMFVGSESEEYFLICRLPNKSYTAELTNTMQKHGKLLDYLKTQDNKAYNEKDRELQAGVLAKTIVIGWGKAIAVKGKAIKYSLKNCIMLLQDYPDLRAACVEFAADVSNYPAEMDVDNIKKN